MPDLVKVSHIPVLPALIPVNQHLIGADTIPTVNARDLHAFLKMDSLKTAILHAGKILPGVVVEQRQLELETHQASLVTQAALMPASQPALANTLGSTKTCTQCNANKSLEEFSRRSASRDGLSPKCKTCCRIWRSENRAHLRAYQRRWTSKHKETVYARNRRYRENHRDADIARSHTWYEANREVAYMRQKAYRALHREKYVVYAFAYRALHYKEHKDYMQAYRQNNRNRMCVWGSRYRARRANAPVNDFTLAQWAEIQTAYGYRCVYCPPTCWRCRQKKHKLTQDHIMPLSKGGPHTASNIVPACGSCNSKKKAGAPLVPVQPLLLTIAPAQPRIL